MVVEGWLDKGDKGWTEAWTTVYTSTSSGIPWLLWCFIGLIHHHVTDTGPSLGLLHTGKDELKAEQEFMVIMLFLLKVWRLLLM